MNACVTDNIKIEAIKLTNLVTGIHQQLAKKDQNFTKNEEESQGNNEIIGKNTREVLSSTCGENYKHEKRKSKNCLSALTKSTCCKK